MVLRKPYAILIKNFKLIHIVLTLLMIFFVVKTNNVIGYIKNYISIGNVPENIGGFVNFFVVITIVIIIAASIFMYFLMRFKNKPKLLYLIIIICYVASIIVMGTSVSQLEEAKRTILDPKNIRLYRDLMTGSMIYQYLMIAIMAFRGMGFDIKRFNFRADLEELNIEVTDDEEVEITSPINTEALTRSGHRFLREMRYFVEENKKIFMIIASIIAIVIIYGGVTLFLNRTRYYGEKTSVKGEKYTVSVLSSYVTNNDYRGNKILTGDETIVVIKLNIKTNYEISNWTLNLNDFKLIIGKVGYLPVTTYYASLYDLGVGYQDQYITTKNNTFIISYVIDKKDSSKKMMLRFQETLSYQSASGKAGYMHFNLKPDYFKTNKTIDSVNLNTDLNIDGSILPSTKLKIVSFETNNEFVYKYTYKSGSDSIVYTNVVTPSASNKQKTILKLEPIINDYSISKMAKFFTDFGTLKYKIDDKEYTATITDKTPKNSNIEDNKYIYFEVPVEVVDASNISFEFNVRNIKYSYILK